jgi:enoyl-CoA hydratase/carnithine racemase
METYMDKNPAFDQLLVTREDGIATITLNRPQVHNALNRSMVDQLAGISAELDLDASVRVVVITGQGKSFCAGLDLKEALPTTMDELLRDGLGDREALFRIRKPLIAAVSGAALGAGLEIALMCDLIICDSTARFSMPEVTRGGMPGAGGTQRLSRLVGRMRATELCLTGRVVQADEAVRIGLALYASKDPDLLKEVLDTARRIAEAESMTSMLIKQACRTADDIGLSMGLNLERLSSYNCIANRAAQGTRSK